MTNIKYFLPVLFLTFSFLLISNINSLSQEIFCSTDPDLTIQIDNTGPVPYVVDIPDVGAIEDVNVFFQIDNLSLDDIRASLTSPSDTTILLVSENGGFTFPNSYGTPDSCPTPDFILDDDAATSIQDSGDGPIIGTFSPIGSLGDFIDESSEGTWTLNLTDDQIGNGTTLNCWCLEITAPGTTASNVAPAPTLSQWGFIIFSIFSGLIAVWFIRKRQLVA